MKNYKVETIEKYIHKHTINECEQYVVRINKRNCQVNKPFGTYEEAKTHRDNILRLLELKNMEKIKVDLDLKEWPYNLIEALSFDLESVIEHFEERLENLCKEQRTLTEKEYDMLIKCYKEGLILQEIGDIYNVTRERVRQIISRAIRRLRYRIKYFLCGDYQNPEKLARKEFEEIKQELFEKWTYESAMDFLTKYELSHPRSVGDQDICELDFTVRTWNCLRRAGITTVDELSKFSVEQLMKIRNLGRKSMKEVINKMNELGYEIK